MKPKPQLTPDQLHCVATLADWACGAHHLPEVRQFGDGVCISYSGDLSTYDGDRLTRLVLLAHRDAVRFEVSSSEPRMVRIAAWRRKHGDKKTMRFSEWHPTLADLEQRCRECREITT